MTPLKTKSSLAEQLLNKLRLRTATVSVIGLGYVGLPLAETFAWGGYNVVGFDIDEEKIARLKAGESYIRHISSQRISDLRDSERFSATAEPSCFRDADAIVICVPTPLTETREPDLSFIEGTARLLKDHVRKGQLIVLESTTYPGTTEDLLLPILEQSGLHAGSDFFLAFSPEREDPGNPVYSTRNIPKVVGGLNAVSRELALALYEPVVEGVIPVSSTRVAEACKILENTYRAVNIALVNELKVIFDAMGIDVWEVIEAAKSKPFGFQAFYPGPGLGGHCIPIDPFYLTWIARKHGVYTRFIELAGEINTAMPKYVVRRTAEALNEDGKALKGAKVCVLGVAYKKNVDDPRESPAFVIMEMLQTQGAEVSYHDPYVPALPAMRHHKIRGNSAELTPEFVDSQDCFLIVTDHSNVDYRWLGRNAKLVVDTRNAMNGLASPGCRVVKG